MRILLATLLLFGLVASPARAEELGLRVVSASSLRRTTTMVQVRPGGALIDFGSTSNVGAPPANGRRFQLPDGSAHFVATVQLEIVETSSSTGLPKKSTVDSIRGSRWSIETLPSRGAARPRDVYAILDVPPDDHGSVRIAPAGTDWSAGLDVGTDLGAFEIPVASQVRAGDRLAFDLSLYAPADVAGLRIASVRFVVR